MAGLNDLATWTDWQRVPMLHTQPIGLLYWRERFWAGDQWVYRLMSDAAAALAAPHWFITALGMESCAKAHGRGVEPADAMRPRIAVVGLRAFDMTNLPFDRRVSRVVADTLIAF